MFPKRIGKNKDLIRNKRCEISNSKPSPSQCMSVERGGVFINFYRSFNPSLPRKGGDRKRINPSRCQIFQEVCVGERRGGTFSPPPTCYKRIDILLPPTFWRDR